MPSISKEEILERVYNEFVEKGDLYSYTDIMAKEAMDLFAKQVSIGFAEWVNEMDIHMVNAGYWQRNNPAFQEKHTAESTQELFELYLKSIEQ